jgi:aminopeptidase N
MKKTGLLCAFVCAATMSNAQVDSSDTLQKTDLDTITVTASAGPAVYRASAPRIWDIIHTRVALTFDRKEKTADAREWIKLRPYFYATDTVVLDAKDMRIDSVLQTGKKGNTALSYSYENDELKIKLGKTYKSTDTIELYLRYTAMPYTAKHGGSSAITDDKGLYFINTDGQSPSKPAHIWTQGETESNSKWMITIDKPNTRFTTQIELTVPDSLTTLSNGALVKQTKLKGGLRTDIWKMNMPIQAYAVMFAIGKYTVVKEKWQQKEVSYYVEPAYGPYAKEMFGYTPEMMTYFSQKTGVAYPWNKYSQVAVRDYVSGAMENTTASLFGEFMNQTSREMKDKDYEDIVAHELFHQWFGDYVTCESWSNLTMNESFANYGEQLWRTYKHGKNSGDELAWNDLQIYLGSSRAHDPELVRFHYDGREEMFDAISYNKGGAILRYLNWLTGDAAFEKAMKIYLTKNALQSAEAHNWRLAVEEATGLDWNWFFNQWYYHESHPILKVSYEYDDNAGQLKVEVKQIQDDSTIVYHLPLKTKIVYGAEQTTIDWDITRRTQTFTYPYHGTVKPVLTPDAAHVLPGELRENKTSDNWLAQYLTADGYVDKRLAVMAAGKHLSDSSAQVIIDLALSDNLASIRRTTLGQLSRVQRDKYRRRWTDRIMEMATSDADNKVRAEAYDVLGSWKTYKAKQIMLAAVWDSSYAVAGNALEALERIDKDTAYAVAKQILKTNPLGGLEGPVWAVIAQKGADEDLPLFIEKTANTYGSKSIGFALKLNIYLKNTSSEETVKSVVHIYADMVRFETMKSYRQALGGFLFQAISEQKGKLKDKDETIANKATLRMETLKTAAQKIVDAEQDSEVKEKFEKMIKDNFE